MNTISVTITTSNPKNELQCLYVKGLDADPMNWRLLAQTKQPSLTCLLPAQKTEVTFAVHCEGKTLAESPQYRTTLTEDVNVELKGAE